jgi:hypothetical protein
MRTLLEQEESVLIMHRRMLLGALLPAMLAGAVPARAQDPGTARTFATQTSSGTVVLEVTPSWTAEGRLVVTLAANTHSGDLGSLNLLEAVRLHVDEIEYAPAEAGSLSGHHAQAKIVFTLPEPPSAFRLEIREGPSVPARVLKWPIEGVGGS